MEDRHIIALLQQRSETAISAIAERLGGRLLAIARNILGSDRDAQECVNDTYLALWNSIPPEEPDPLSAYACRIARNTALSRLRKNSAAKRSGDYDLSLEELTECIGEDTLQRAVDARALGDAIDRFLDTLPKENRILFLRRHWFGDSVKTIAADRGLTESAVSVRLNRTRNKLKDYLIKEGFYEP